MQNQKDYYTILEIDRKASPEDIKRSWRRLAHKHHPDKPGGDEERFKEINEAYYVLSDPGRRAQYDRFGVAGPAGAPGGVDYSGFAPFTEGFDDWFSDVLESFFGVDFGQKRTRRGKDVHVEVYIPFEKSYAGSREELVLTLPRPCARCAGSGGEPGSNRIVCNACKGAGRLHRVEQTFLGAFTRLVVCPECHGRKEVPETSCTTCRGSGKEQRTEHVDIDVPAGIDDNDTLKIAGGGEAGQAGLRAGDLYVTVRVAQSARFRRQEDDLSFEEDVSFPTAVLGGAVSVRFPDSSLRLTIPAGTHSGHTFKIKNRGFPRRSGRGKGDAFVRVEVHVPKKISSRAKKAIEDIAKELETE